MRPDRNLTPYLQPIAKVLAQLAKLYADVGPALQGLVINPMASYSLREARYILGAVAARTLGIDPPFWPGDYVVYNANKPYCPWRSDAPRLPQQDSYRVEWCIFEHPFTDTVKGWRLSFRGIEGSFPIEHFLKPPAPLAPGTAVHTLEPNMELRKEWTDEVWEARRWGVEGVIVSHSDSHGLCYQLRFQDGSTAWYDPTEIQIVEQPETQEPPHRLDTDVRVDGGGHMEAFPS